MHATNTMLSMHGLYNPMDLHEGDRRVKLQSLLLFIIMYHCVGGSKGHAVVCQRPRKPRDAQVLFK